MGLFARKVVVRLTRTHWGLQVMQLMGPAKRWDFVQHKIVDWAFQYAV